MIVRRISLRPSQWLPSSHPLPGGKQNHNSKPMPSGAKANTFTSNNTPVPRSNRICCTLLNGNGRGNARSMLSGSSQATDSPPLRRTLDDQFSGERPGKNTVYRLVPRDDVSPVV